MSEHQWKHKFPAIVKLLENIQSDVIDLQGPTKEQVDDLVDQ